MKLSVFIAAAAANKALINVASALDATLPDYQAVGSLSGEIGSVGSDTLNNEMTAWAEAFKAKYPGVKFEIEGRGPQTERPAKGQTTSEACGQAKPAPVATGGARSACL